MKGKGKGKVQGHVCFDLAGLEIGGKFEFKFEFFCKHVFYKRVEGRGNLNGKGRKREKKGKKGEKLKDERKEKLKEGRKDRRKEGRKEEKKGKKDLGSGRI